MKMLAGLFWAALFLSMMPRTSAQQTSVPLPLRLDFGGPVVESGWTQAGPETIDSAARGYGWVGATPDIRTRDRVQPDALRRDFVFGAKPVTFRIHVPPGLYRLTVISGDMAYGDHGTKILLNVRGAVLPEMHPAITSFATLTTTVAVEKDPLDIILEARGASWTVNALTLESAAAPEKVAMTEQRNSRPYPGAWGDVASWPDPIALPMKRFRAQLQTAPPVAQTGLNRADYLKVIAGNIDFFRKYQNKNGAIIDPYKHEEWQYSTPAFAHAASLLVSRAGRKDLIEPAARALDWSAHTLSTRTAATHHEDFFAPMLAHAIPLLKPFVPAAHSARWEADIRAFDPYKTYRSSLGQGNWNVVALSGEALFFQESLRPNLDFVDDSLAGQGASFASPYGLYLEGPMAYDHFPRLWAADMVSHGYAGKYANQLREVLRRGALTSLFMQSPAGELPAGGRSAQHQWNEAEQCVTYEIYAEQAVHNGDTELASVFKRAAHLALRSMNRWIRPSGEMWIVKNYVDPAKRHGFEGYSAHSQYNLLPMAMLAIAYEHAETSETVPERPTPSELGGYVLQIDPKLHKIFADAGGMYIEIDTSGDPHYDATGLIRIHATGHNPQLGPSDSLPNHAVYHRPDGPKLTTGIGVAWRGGDAVWHTLGEQGAATITRVSLSDVQETPDEVSFTVQYEGRFSGPARIVERYVVTPSRVQLTTELPGFAGPLRYLWPMLADDGAHKTTITIKDTVSDTLDGDTQMFTPVGAASVQVGRELFGSHNGWARVGVAEYPAGGKITLRIEPVQAPAK